MVNGIADGILRPEQIAGKAPRSLQRHAQALTIHELNRLLPSYPRATWDTAIIQGASHNAGLLQIAPQTEVQARFEVANAAHGVRVQEQIRETTLPWPD